MDLSEAENPLEDYIKHLATAQIHAQRALDALYAQNGVKRGMYTRIMLGRAQRLLMGLYRMELDRKGGR